MAACTHAVLCILLQISLYWNILLTQDSPHNNRKDDLSLSGCSLISSDTHLAGRRPLFALTARVNYKPVNLLPHYNINYPLHKTTKHGSGAWIHNTGSPCKAVCYGPDDLYGCVGKSWPCEFRNYDFSSPVKQWYC